MMKVSGLVVCAVLLASMPCMAVTTQWLPPVTYSDDCEYVTDINSQAASIITLIQSVVTLVGADLDIPAYDVMDLENGMDGDGIPDKWQLALLGSALCANGTGLQIRLTENTAKLNTLITDLQNVVAILLGSSPTTTAQARLNAVADILGSGDIADQLRSAALEIGGVTAQLPSSINLAMITQTLNTLKQYLTSLGALLGLSTEMQETILSLVNQDLKDDINDIRGEVVAVIDQVPTLLQMPGLSQDQKNQISALATDAQIIVDALDRTMALLEPGGILLFGISAKSTGEPFAAMGDYDGDGISNLDTYNATKDSSIATFVSAASGANPFYPGNPNLPVAGILGLMAMAGACVAGGALSIRRKK